MKSDNTNCCKNGSNVTKSNISKIILLPLTLLLSPIVLIMIIYHLIKYKSINLNKIIKSLANKKNGKIYL